MSNPETTSAEPACHSADVEAGNGSPVAASGSPAPYPPTFSVEELRILADSPLQIFWPAVALHWCADEIERLRNALATAESEARRYASFYPYASDGRNTFLLFADRIGDLTNDQPRNHTAQTPMAPDLPLGEEMGQGTQAACPHARQEMEAPDMTNPETTTEDLVAILDRWIAECIDMPGPAKVLAWHAKCARDEIVALRKVLNSLPRTDIMGYERSIRADALEEAANVADDACLGSSCRVIHAIRALKGGNRCLKSQSAPHSTTPQNGLPWTMRPTTA